MKEQLNQSAQTIINSSTDVINDTIKEVSNTVKNTFKWYFYMILIIGGLISTSLLVGLYKLVVS